MSSGSSDGSSACFSSGFLGYPPLFCPNVALPSRPLKSVDVKPGFPIVCKTRVLCAFPSEELKKTAPAFIENGNISKMSLYNLSVYSAKSCLTFVCPELYVTVGKIEINLISQRADGASSVLNSNNKCCVSGAAEGDKWCFQGPALSVFT